MRASPPTTSCWLMSGAISIAILALSLCSLSAVEIPFEDQPGQASLDPPSSAKTLSQPAPLPGLAPLTDSEFESEFPKDEYFSELLPSDSPPSEIAPPPADSLLSVPDSETAPSSDPLSSEIPLEEKTAAPTPLDFYQVLRDPYSNYRVHETSYSYLPANAENFGWLSFQSAPYHVPGCKNGLTAAINLHLLSGPESVPLPPRLWDFILGYQHRGTFSELLSYDLATSIGVFSDFEDSARDGVRFPSHAVGMLHTSPNLDIVFGADYIDRDDLPLLPVFGLSIHPESHPALRLDLVFPRPRIDYVLSCRHRVYLAGFMDGGSWDIEFPDQSNDVMTYHDLKAVLGFELADPSGSISALEFGYVFDRRLQFRDLRDQTDFNEAFALRLIWQR